MVNQKGEFPMTETITIRVHPSEKERAKKLPQTFKEIFMYGLNALSDEAIRLKFEVDLLEELVAKKDVDVNNDRALLIAKKRRLRMIAPHELDDETLASMLVESARDYAFSIFNKHGAESILKIEKSLAKSSIKSEGRDLGYNEDSFFVEVKNQLEEMCNTETCDISDDDLLGGVTR
ncbi:hypothetical protein [Methanobrevibacter sp.]|uniref:hypothetical protein n=1 Tax=Methanobrevibacter sp. TaxID=66852 RepID=UPI0038905591